MPIVRTSSRLIVAIVGAVFCWLPSWDVTRHRQAAHRPAKQELIRARLFYRRTGNMEVRLWNSARRRPLQRLT